MRALKKIFVIVGKLDHKTKILDSWSITLNLKLIQCWTCHKKCRRWSNLHFRFRHSWIYVTIKIIWCLHFTIRLGSL